MSVWNAQHNRIEPNLGPAYFKSYSIRAPLATHWRAATCQEFECDDIIHGFVLSVDTSTELGQKQYHYVTHDTSRQYSMQKIGETQFRFVYKPGSQPFAGAKHEHRVPIGRPPRLLVLDGDWRGNPRGTPPRVHSNIQDWVDDFATHQEDIKKAVER